jgi:predicted RNA binding protein YcfA (HicA-like mRNA interferase family)
MYHNPETERRTTVPMGPNDLHEGTLRSILKQAGLTVAQFRDLLR